MTLEISSGIALSGFLFSLVSIYMLKSKNRIDRTKIYLIALFCVIAISSLKRFLDSIGVQSFHFNLIIKSHLFFFGPLLYLFVKSSLSEKQIKFQIHHIIPVAVYFVLISLIFFSQNVFELIQFYQLYFLTDAIGLVINLIYFIYSLYLVIRSKRILKFDRTIFFLSLFGILYAGWSMIIVSTFFRLDSLAIFSINYTWTIIPICAFLYVLYEIKKQQQSEQFIQHIKINKSEHDVLLEQIKKVLIEDKEFLNPLLIKSTFAKKLQIKPAFLSFVLFNTYKRTFNEMLTDLRLADFNEKVLAGESKNLTLFAIAQSSGFKSKATFYKAFKDKFNTTPHRFFSGVLKSS